MFIPVSPETVLCNNAFPRQEAQVSDHLALLAGSNKALSPGPIDTDPVLWLLSTISGNRVHLSWSLVMWGG